jgi:phage-related protein
MWKLTTPGMKLPSDYGSTQWDDIEVADKGKNTFTLSLKKNDKVIAMDVTPVLVGKNYEKAMAEYNQRLADYQVNIKEKEAKLNDLKQNFEKEKAFEREMAKKSTAEKVEMYRANGQNDMASEEILKDQVINHFKVTSMGMWNCDRPLEPDFLMVNSNFKNETGEVFDNQMAFMVSKSQNTVSSFYASKDKPLYFNPSLKYTLWMVTPDNKLAVYTTEKFEEMKKKNLGKNERYDFVMTKIDRELKSEADVRAILNL